MSDEKEVTRIKNRLSIKKPLIIFTTVILVLCSSFFIYEQTKYQSTDDAYIETTTVNVAPKISGEIVEVYVKDNQQVNRGDVIAKIDPRDYDVELEQAQAAYKK